MTLCTSFHYGQAFAKHLISVQPIFKADFVIVQKGYLLRSKNKKKL